MKRTTTAALAVVTCLAASACRGDDAPPAPDDEGADAVDAPGSEAARADTTALATPSGPPTTAEEFFAALPSGVVSRELVGRCVTRAAPADLVARAQRCGQDAAATGCDAPIAPGVVALDADGLMTIVTTPWLEPCGGPTYLRGFQASPPWLHPDTVTTWEPEDGPIVKALSWIARVTRRDTPADNIVRWACALEAWTTPLERLAVLGPPLDGWMVTIARGRRALPVRLVAPGNMRVHELGAIDLGPGLCDTEGTSRDDICEREVSAAIDQIVLSGSKRTLVLTVRIAPSERCVAQHVMHTAFRLPDGVRAHVPRPDDHGIQRRGAPVARPPE